MLTGENGILTQAQRAKTETENAQAEEENILANYESVLNSYSGENTEFTDSLGNKVKVPAGFKVVNPGDNVEDGIIIEDVTHGATAGSQFVWIPVGTVHRKDKEDIRITLGRYVYKEDGTIDTELSKTEPGDQLATASSGNYFTEGLKDSVTANTHAKDIEMFRSKVNSTGGYYIGRYESRDGTTNSARINSTSDTNQVVLKASSFVYNWVTQPQAAILSQNMYNDSNFESDLMNSYAWNTAIDFLQKCDDREGEDNKPYSRQNSLNAEIVAEQGTNNQIAEDVICNVYDMASNCAEWTTETFSGSSGPTVIEGGTYNYSTYYTSLRNVSSTTGSWEFIAFRPIIYL